MIQFFKQFISDLASFLWGLPLLILLIGGGVYLLIRSNFLQFRYFGHAFKILSGKYDDPNATGQITHFQSLSTALSSTVGMGNISGVAVAIAVGGPGAIFWMWISAIIGMSTKFFTATLSIMYRGKDDKGNIQGGPMYVITEGLGKSWKPLAVFFSICVLVGALPIFNVNQLTQAINDIILTPNGVEVDDTSNFIIGLILIIITSIVVLGGLHRISKVASKLVPAMVILYFILVLIILFVNYQEVPKYLVLIFTDAFEANYIKPDSFYGATLGTLIVLGIRRGAFSNEAGIGTAAMAHGAAKTDEPVKEGLVAMLGPFIDTIIVCTLTALSILVTGVWQTSDSNGVSLTATAFNDTMPGIGNYLLLVCVVIFSVSSLFSYSYYGTKALAFIAGSKYKKLYNYVFILSILLGTVSKLDTMINLIDSFFALMSIPTMLSTLILAPKVVLEIKKYKAKLDKEQ